MVQNCYPQRVPRPPEPRQWQPAAAPATPFPGRATALVVPPRRAAYDEPVPRYEYRCRACGDTFEQTRPMSQSGDPATCPQGHDDTVKLLSTVAVGGRAGT